ncbi:MAG: hypothetical protein L3J28_11215 [Candidatus Polarisedimenticolaceae bacterium]|nr:hypothetical protein [Candidatus Polarisedimenticolaceae bacterium]
MTSELLFLSYKQGDLHAFKSLYNQHKESLYCFLLRQTGQCDVTEELYQQIWREVRTRSDYVIGNSFKPYLYSVANEVVLKYYTLEYGALPTSFNVDYFPKRQKGQVAMTDELNAATTLLFQLRRLPAAQRLVFLLYTEVGLNIDLIAGCIGCGREIVKTRLRYAVSFLNSSITIVDDHKRLDTLRLYAQLAKSHPTITLSHYVISEALFATTRLQNVAPAKRKRLIKKASKVTSTIVESLKRFVA